MPSVDITQQLYEYLNNHLVNGSIDATIRTLISQEDLSGAELGLYGVTDHHSQDSDTNDGPQDDTVVGGKGDSTNSGYIR